MARYLNEEDKFCSNCGEKIKNIYHDILDEYNNTVIECVCPKCVTNIMKVDWRKGNLDPKSAVGKGFIGQQIVAKTFGIEDCNLKMKNFNFYIDLSKISGYGYGEVKIASLDMTNDIWYFDTDREQYYDILFLVCMDENWPWKNVERIYAIPWEVVGYRKKIGIYNNPSRGGWYKEFRIDEKSFNDTYHNMNLTNCKVLRKNKGE